MIFLHRASFVPRKMALASVGSSFFKVRLLKPMILVFITYCYWYSATWRQSCRDEFVCTVECLLSKPPLRLPLVNSSAFLKVIHEAMWCSLLSLLTATCEALTRPVLCKGHRNIVLKVDYSGGSAVWGVGLRPLNCRDCGFEFLWGYECSYFLFAVCYVSSGLFDGLISISE